MDQAEIGEFVKQYSIEPWVKSQGFVEPEDYFNFKDRIESQLQQLEGEEPNIDKVKPMRNAPQVRGAAQTVASENLKK